jgi:hypothetical protein
MRAFIITLVVVVVLGLGLAWYVQHNKSAYAKGSILRKTGELLTPAQPEPLLRTPQDYHLLQDQGGVPREEAEKSGLSTDSYAYLATMEPIQISKGVEQVGGISLNDKHYDFCYKFNSTPPEEQYLEFNLLGKWDELHFGFGYDDSHPSDPDNKWSIEFRAEADGKAVFGPVDLTPVDKPVFNKLEVSGVNRVTFVIRRIGFENPFTPVLVDPFVIKLTSD